ncbi:hypothetical protein [Gordonia soli]|uniref:Uncharacterized protein n=1 Tax=Gordonia soli NBRC 108243 TaxID=1223545 RepID=M0QM01_9ACTN|nr:hypothetical protein [Gordonia soli]GAC69608.1 hypothetical protein GS4_26_00560 [Gordonia soli NBRC 108243]
MTLVNPSRRWWNRPRFRALLPWVSWGVSAVLWLIVGWSLTDGVGVDSSPWVVPVVSTFALGLMLGGTFLVAFGGSDDAVDLRSALVPTTSMFVALGVAEIVHAMVVGVRPRTESIVFVCIGGVSTAAVFALHHFWSARRRSMAIVARNGVPTSGRVTRVSGFWIDYRPVTRATVQFTGADGRTRWTTQTIEGSVAVGDRVDVRYQPMEGRRRVPAVVTRR